MKWFLPVCWLVLWSGFLPAQTEKFSFAAESARRDADLLIQVLNDLHPGYARYREKGEIELAEKEFRDAAGGCTDLGQFYLQVSRFLAKIRCEHTEAELPPAIAAYRQSRPTMLPVDFEWLAGAAIITGLAPGSTGVEVGDELLEVNGEPMSDLFSAIAPAISVDGFTDHTKAAIFSGTDDIGLTTLDVFFPLLHGFTDNFQLTVRSPNSVVQTVTLPAVNESDSLAARGARIARQNFSDEGAVRWEKRNETAVLVITTFVNYRTPVDPDAVFGKVFRAIRESGAKRLVIDFRGVGGGSTDVMTSLLRHLADRAWTVGGPSFAKTYDFKKYRQYLSTWDESIFALPSEFFTPDANGLLRVDPQLTGGPKTLEPAADAWAGPLAILIGPANESGSTILLAELRCHRTVELLGEPTGGSAEGPTASIIAFLKLPESEMTVRVPLLRSSTSFRDFIPGMGMKPDVEIRPSIADLRAGRDPVLEFAVQSR